MDLRDAELRRFTLLQQGLDHINQGITVIDSELRLMAWNRRFFTMLDFPETLARVGTPFTEFMRFNAERGEYGQGEVDDQVRVRVAEARKFKAHYFERTRPTTGQIIAIRGEPLEEGGFITVYTDITEQRYYEAMIRERNDELDRRVRDRTLALETANQERDRIAQRLALVTDAVPALIAYLDHALVYHFANRGYAEWFGYTKDSIIGRTAAEVLGKDLLRHNAPHVATAFTGRQVSYDYSMDRQGRRVHARSTLVPDVSPDGSVAGLYVLSYDITEQKRTEAALIQAQKMEAVGQLTGGLAHDFNNLLTIVVGNLAGLQEQLSPQPDVEDLLAPALAAARRGVELTRRLLAFSRRQPLEPAAVDIRQLVGGLLQLLKRSLPESVTIHTRFAETGLYALADPHQLESALLNLTLNARDALPDGGRVDIATDILTAGAEQAAEAEVAPGRYLRITVADDGQGMSEEALPHAFEPFFTTKPFGSGSGLGLAMVYGFVKQSGGGIRLASRPGQGTTVTILLPLAEAPPVPAAAPPLDDTPQAAPRLVLLVEDDREVRKVIRRQLTDLGCVVVEAADGREAMRMLNNIAEIEVLLTDVVMPGGMAGQARAAEAARLRPTVRVVLMSGYHDSPTTPDLPILLKPFSRKQRAMALK